MKIRMRIDGSITTQKRLIKSLNGSMVLPKIWTENTFNAVGADPVLPTPKPAITELQVVQPNGVEQDLQGNWVEAWLVVDKFSDYTDENDFLVTKAAQEATHLANLQAEANKQALDAMVTAIETLIQARVDTYNEAQGVLFKNVDACAKYLNTPTYTHYQFCNDVIVWQTDVWEAARTIQTDVVAGNRTMPTVDGLLAELPVYGGSV